MKFFTAYVRPAKTPEMLDPESNVERAGYMTIEQKIKRFEAAGVKLENWQKAQYDFQSGEEVPDDVQPDPTRNPALDLSEAVALYNGAAERLMASMEAAKEKKKAERGMKLVEGSENALEAQEEPNQGKKKSGANAPE